MSASVAIRNMLAAGLTIEQALIAMEAAEAAGAFATIVERPVSSSAVRMRRLRERHKASQVTESVTSDGCDAQVTLCDAPHARLTCAEPEPNKTTYPTTSEAKASSVEPPIVAKPKSDRAGCIEALSAVLSPSRAIAVLEHRAKLRKPLTPHAAALLAKSLSQSPEPDAAADEMIERGWQGWRSDWGRDSRAPPPRQAKRNSLLDGLDEIERRFAPNVQQFPRIAG